MYTLTQTGCNTHTHIDMCAHWCIPVHFVLLHVCIHICSEICVYASHAHMLVVQIRCIDTFEMHRRLYIQRIVQIYNVSVPHTRHLYHIQGICTTYKVSVPHTTYLYHIQGICTTYNVLYACRLSSQTCLSNVSVQYIVQTYLRCTDN